LNIFGVQSSLSSHAYRNENEGRVFDALLFNKTGHERRFELKRFRAITGIPAPAAELEKPQS
jgi:hypothetical protein